MSLDRPGSFRNKNRKSMKSNNSFISMVGSQHSKHSRSSYNQNQSKIGNFMTSQRLAVPGSDTNWVEEPLSNLRAMRK